MHPRPRRLLRAVLIAGALVVATVLAPVPLAAQVGVEQATDGLNFPFLELGVRDAQSNEEVVLSLQLLLLLAILALAPSIVVLMTSFLRIAIVFDFIKRALSLQQVPPNQVLMGVALFLTLFIMWPTLDTINEQAIQPFAEGELGT